MDVEKRRAELASGSLDPSTFWRLALNLHPPNKPDGEGVGFGFGLGRKAVGFGFGFGLWLWP